jgi:hypothetical protein
MIFYLLSLYGDGLLRSDTFFLFNNIIYLRNLLFDYFLFFGYLSFYLDRRSFSQFDRLDDLLGSLRFGLFSEVLGIMIILEERGKVGIIIMKSLLLFNRLII